MSTNCADLESARAAVRSQVSQLCNNLLPKPGDLLKDLLDQFPATSLDFLNGIGTLTPDLRARVDDLLHQWVPAIDGFIHDMHRDGTLKRLSLKYYGIDLTVRR